MIVTRWLRARPARWFRLLTCAMLVCANAALLAPTAASAVPPGGAYQPLAAPQRVLDSRHGIGASGPIAGGATITLSLGAGLAMASVVLNVTVTAPVAAGDIRVYPADAPVPGASNLNFVRGQTVANLVVVRASSSGQVDLRNDSSGTVQLVADLSGQFSAGSGSAQGAYVPLPAPQRMLDTRHTTALAPNSWVAVPLGSKIVSGASAAVLNVTVVAPTAPGNITVYADGTSRPNASNLNFVAGQTVPNLVIAPVSSSGVVRLYNASSGSVQLLVDLSGSFVGGDPVATGDLGALSPARLLDTRTGDAVGAGQTVTLTVKGRGGVPLSAVSAVVLNVTVTAPQQPGSITVWDGSGGVPNASNLNFAAGQTVPNLVVAPVSPAGTVALHNGSSGTVHLIADVFGYVLNTNLAVPATSTGRYVRNLNGGSTDSTTMQSEGCTDAKAGARFVVLDIGAQSIHAPLSATDPGVVLTQTTVRFDYAHLVAAIKGYIEGFTSVTCAAPTGATVAVATNSDGDFTTYTAGSKGQDWANLVIDPLRAYAGSKVSVVGADDIESGFAATESEAENWETAFLDDPGVNDLVFIGSANGCPTTFGGINTTCDPGWTQAQYNRLAGGADPTRVQALPQVYTPALAVQWANIDASGPAISFAGALTEYAACPLVSASCSVASLPPSQGWAALYHALSTVVPAPSLPAVTDLRIS